MQMYRNALAWRVEYSAAALKTLKRLDPSIQRRILSFIDARIAEEPEVYAMTDATKTLSAQARKLSPRERVELVDDILASLDEPDPNIDRL